MPKFLFEQGRKKRNRRLENPVSLFYRRTRVGSMAALAMQCLDQSLPN
jgi:hypothetical protein